jgi:hypothetical protein
MSTNATVKLRQITELDINDIAELLSEGFPTRGKSYWLRGLHRMTRRNRPPQYPSYGYLLESGSAPVGVILLFFSSAPSSDGMIVRCNLSSWYVQPKFRIFSSLLVTAATKDPAVTYFNISAVPHTWPAVEAQGFSAYCTGQFYAMPALCRPAKAVSIEVFDPSMKDAGFKEYDVLRQHSEVGSLSLLLRQQQNIYPFVFQNHRVKNLLPIYRLAYCADIASFTRFAGNLGRFLLARRRLWVALDANAPILGLPGWYTQKRGRKYAKGPHPPRLADLSETEAAFFDS